MFAQAESARPNKAQDLRQAESAQPNKAHDLVDEQIRRGVHRRVLLTGHLLQCGVWQRVEERLCRLGQKGALSLPINSSVGVSNPAHRSGVNTYRSSARLSRTSVGAAASRACQTGSVRISCSWSGVA